MKTKPHVHNVESEAEVKVSEETIEEPTEESLLAILTDVQVLVEAVRRVREIADNLIAYDTKVSGKQLGHAIIKTIENAGEIND